MTTTQLRTVWLKFVRALYLVQIKIPLNLNFSNIAVTYVSRLKRRQKSPTLPHPYRHLLRFSSVIKNLFDLVI